MKFLPTVSIEDRELLSGRLMMDSWIKSVESGTDEITVTIVVPLNPQVIQDYFDEYFLSLPEEVRKRNADEVALAMLAAGMPMPKEE